jgi:hypothetical protein
MGERDFCYNEVVNVIAELYSKERNRKSFIQ